MNTRTAILFAAVALLACVHAKTANVKIKAAQEYYATYETGPAPNDDSPPPADAYAPAYDPAIPDTPIDYLANVGTKKIKPAQVYGGAEEANSPLATAPEEAAYGVGDDEPAVPQEPVVPEDDYDEPAAPDVPAVPEDDGDDEPAAPEQPSYYAPTGCNPILPDGNGYFSNGVDLPSGDVGSVPAASLADCVTACHAFVTDTASCTAAVWNSNSNMCYMKDCSHGPATSGPEGYYAWDSCSYGAETPASGKKTKAAGTKVKTAQVYEELEAAPPPVDAAEYDYVPPPQNEEPEYEEEPEEPEDPYYDVEEPVAPDVPVPEDDGDDAPAPAEQPSYYAPTGCNPPASGKKTKAAGTKVKAAQVSNKRTGRKANPRLRAAKNGTKATARNRSAMPLKAIVFVASSIVGMIAVVAAVLVIMRSKRFVQPIEKLQFTDLEVTVVVDE